MKKLFYFMLSLIILLAIDCKKIDDFAVTANDGKDGYTNYVFYDSLAKMDVTWQDRDFSLTFNPNNPQTGPGFKADTVLVRTPIKGTEIIVLPDGCTQIWVTVGTSRTLKSTVCNGKDAFNTVYSYHPVLDLIGDTIGFSVGYYWDTNSNGVLDTQDPLKFMTPVVKFPTNGQDGSTGPAGPAPTFDVNIAIIGNNVVYSISLNGVTTSVSVPIPQSITGAQGSAGFPTLIVTKTKQGIYYIFFGDENNNGVIDENEKSKTIFVPYNGGPTIVALTFFKDFLGQSSTEAYEANGWKFENSGISDGLMYIRGTGSITTPCMRDSLGLLSLTINRASSITRKVEIFAVMDDDSEKLIIEKEIKGIENLQIDEISKFDLLEFYADLSKLDISPYNGIKAVKVKSTPVGKCIPTDELLKAVTINFNDNHTGR